MAQAREGVLLVLDGFDEVPTPRSAGGGWLHRASLVRVCLCVWGYLSVHSGAFRSVSGNGTGVVGWGAMDSSFLRRLRLARLGPVSARN